MFLSKYTLACFCNLNIWFFSFLLPPLIARLAMLVNLHRLFSLCYSFLERAILGGKLLDLCI